jgi:hypothetical protein
VFGRMAFVVLFGCPLILCNFRPRLLQALTGSRVVLDLALTNDLLMVLFYSAILATLFIMCMQYKYLPASIHHNDVFYLPLHAIAGISGAKLQRLLVIGLKKNYILKIN